MFSLRSAIPLKSHRRTMAVGLSTLALVVVAVAASTSYATPPGKNGQIAFRRYFNADHTWGAVFTVNTDGSGVRQVTHPPRGTLDDQPDWSPDGAQIAFERCRVRCEVWVVSADGSEPRRIGPACLTVPVPECEDRSAPVWSPDGQLIAFNRAWGPVDFDTIKFSASSVMTKDGADVRDLLVSMPYGGDVGQPMWSPDGKRLVFGITHNARRSDKPKNHIALFVMNTDGTGVRQLTRWALDAGDHPDWSPDGKLILFRSNNDVEGKQSQLYVIRPDGRGLKQLTHFKRGTIVTSASFSPDGRWIVFGKGRGANADVFVMRANGKGMRPVTRTRLWESAPDWGPAR
jgi:TolB protein